MISLRPASEADEKFLWLLRNDVAIRNALYLRRAASLSDYRRELGQILSDQTQKIYIVADNLVGDVGFVHLVENATHISLKIGISANDRGRGYGRQAVALTKQEYANMNLDVPLVVRIPPAYYKTYFFFEACGFVEVGVQLESKMLILEWKP